MKLRLPRLHKQRLHTATRRLPQRVMEESDSDPNMKLSSAFLVVLVLHVVAVGGIYAFNSIKAHKSALAATASERPPLQAEAKPDVKRTEPTPAAVRTPGVPPANAKSASSSARSGAEPKSLTRPPSEVAKKAEPTAKKGTSPGAKAETYTVVKGDNALFIAKRFGVNYDELLKANKIEDPKKLQIGQKLTLPSRSR